MNFKSYDMHAKNYRGRDTNRSKVDNIQKSFLIRLYTI